MRRYVLMLSALLLAQSVVAEEVTSEPQPEVVITPRDNGRVKEYRVNGRLYMIEIKPSKGPSYFLVDTDGDGSLDTRENDVSNGIQIPSWPLLRW